MNEKDFREYCTGCGLCKSVSGIIFEEDNRGYKYPFLRKDDLKLCSTVCPAGGKASYEMKQGKIWGETETVYLGWSTSSIIRTQASSGGVLTALCCYILENGIVDGIIHTQADDKIVYATKTVISRTKDELMKCMGSRYAISSPLSEIKQIVKENEIYAFVGKPCDVSTLRMYLKQDENLQTHIKYLFSFFCAGEPSNLAQKKLLNQLGCINDEDCISLQYRGNGWPGYATAIKNDGTQERMTYNDSWGKILGRDVRKCCRVCLDGIGEYADIACGDAWHLTENKKPDFTESEGRNVIFARNEEGNLLLKNALDEGEIVLEDYSRQIDDLQYIQKYQYERRAAMGTMITALKVCGKKVPQYDKSTLRNFAKHLSLGKKAKRFLGTIKRIHQGTF